MRTRSLKDFSHTPLHRSGKLSLRAALYLIFGTIFFLFFFFTLFGLRESLWNGRTRLTIVSVAPPGLISFDPQNTQITVIPFSQGFKLHLTLGYGDYQFDKVFDLDKQEKKNGKLLLSSIENVFGIPVVGWISQNSSGQILPNFRDLLSGKLHSNLSLFDLVRFLWLVNMTARTNIQTADLSANYLIKAQNNIDGGVDLVLAQDKWDLWARNNLFDPAIDGEKITVTVINDTDHQGLGNQVARQIENLGASVVRVVNGRQAQEQCSILGRKDLGKSQTVSTIKHLFACRWTEGDSSSQRADIVVTIGKNYWRFLNQKISL